VDFFMVPIEIGELLLQLARGILAEREKDRLTSAQWVALRFFSRANVFSRTLSELATYQSTTRGTASQTVKSLEKRGYIKRGKSPYDGRSSILTATDSGRKRMKDDPLLPLFAEIESLDKHKQELLRDILRQLVTNFDGKAQREAIGSCGDCVFLLIRRLKSQSDGVQVNFFCRCVGMPVAESDLGLLCTSFRAKAANRQPHGDAGKS
jgi:DNA-binding MarR family transcriptional regulator